MARAVLPVFIVIKRPASPATSCDERVYKYIQAVLLRIAELLWSVPIVMKPFYFIGADTESGDGAHRNQAQASGIRYYE